MTAPTPFPYEDDNQLPTRPPVRRPVEADRDSATVLAKLEADLGITDQATPFAPYEPGDPIARAVLTIGLIIGIVALTAAVTRGTYTPHIILGCIAAGIATAATGWVAYAITERGQS